VPLFGKPPGQGRETANRELAAARKALEAGDLPHAAMHVANALVGAPALPEVHELLARLASHPQGGRELFPLGESPSLANVLARAHVAASERDYDHALGLLAKAQAFAPATAWADVPWIASQDTAEQASPNWVIHLAREMHGLLRTQDSRELRAAQRPYLPLVRNAIAVHPDNDRLLGIAGFLFRRYDAAEALRYAVRADKLSPSQATAIALGYAHHDLGQTQQALAAWDQAISRGGNHTLKVYGDIQTLLLKADRPAEAISYAEHALAIDEQHSCSQITVLAARFRQSQKAEYFDALIEIYKNSPESSHERGCAASALQIVTTQGATKIAVFRG
jgi:tetratricopeptide (TPR) repeat protein